MKKNILNEVNVIRQQMGLKQLNETELLEIELNEIDLNPINEGWWENAKYALSKLGRYKAGGKIFGKSQTDSKALAQITALLDKKGNEMIKALDTSIKQKNTEFPNNKSQEDFLNTILEIATVYDSIVAATKLKPNDKGYLPIDAANAIIEDLRAYAQKYLDVDLTAAFSVFNEEEIKVKGLEDKDPNDIKVLDYGDPHRTKSGEIDNPMPDGTGFVNEVNTKTQVADKFAGTKDAIKKGELTAYDTERMKTLKSWRLPAALLGAGASFGALSWLVEYIFPPEKITKMTPQEIKQISQDVLGNIKPGEGMTQILNRTLGLNLSPSSNPNDVVKALAKLGGGDAAKGVEIITQKGGIFIDPVAAKKTLLSIVSNPTEHGNTLKQVFSGTWAGTGKAAGDTLVTVTGGNLTGMVVKAATTWLTKTTVVTSAKALIAAPIIKTLGIALATGALVVALSRYKGRKSSRAQILNDLVQFIRPIEGDENNPEVIDDKGSGKNNSNKNNSGTDTQLYNYLKKYFQDIFNFSGQVNKDTYGAGGSGNAPKQYGGSRTITNKITRPDDINDIIKLMENEINLSKLFSDIDVILEADNSLMRSISTKGDNVDTSNKGIEDVGLSQNQLKLFKTHVTRLTQLSKMFSKFNSNDKNLNKLIDQIKTNPAVNIDVNELLSSDPKSLKIFISDFNKAVYSTQFKNGNNLMDQLKKIGINKLNEASQRTPGKSQANAVYNKRREFLKSFPNLIKSFYAVFSYLIDQAKNGTLGTNTNSQQKTIGNQQNTNTNNTQQNTNTNNTQQNTQQNTDGNQQEKPNRLPWQWDPDDEDTWVRTNEDYELMENINIHNNLIDLISESLIQEFGDNQPEMEQGRVNAIQNSEGGRIFTQLANVIPELSTKIASGYKEAYGQQINRVKLADFLQTILGSLANVPQQRMVQMINRSGLDVTAYKRMLRDIKKMDGAETEQPADAKNLPPFNPSTPEKFMPNTVGNYDLTKINQTARVALSQKAAQIISRNNDFDQSADNMMIVLKQLIDDINKNGQKTIPTI
jgi:hypothetical protein